MQSKDIPLPTMDFIERKEKEIKMYSNHSYTNSDIDYVSLLKKNKNKKRINLLINLKKKILITYF